MSSKDKKRKDRIKEKKTNVLKIRGESSEKREHKYPNLNTSKSSSPCPKALPKRSRIVLNDN